MMILAGAQDVGGANALVPVIEELGRRDQARVSVLACGKAAKVFSAAEIKHRTVEVPAEPVQGYYESIHENLAQRAPDALLLGTAWGHSLDKVLLRAAQDQKIPSLAVLDMWSYYRERFVDPASGEVCLPTKLAVMDQLAFDQAVDAGLPASSLVITGQPYLEELAKAFRRRDLFERAESLRRQWLGEFAKEEARGLVLFASEAFSRDLGPGTPYYRGYREVDALEGLVEAARMIEHSHDLRIGVVVKLHPEESDESFQMGAMAQRRQVLVVADQPVWPCLLASDVVVGMTSMLLLESAIAGRPTVSFQPGVQDGDSFVGAQIGLVPAVTSVHELAPVLRGFLEKEAPEHGPEQTSTGTSAHALAQPGAAKRVADLLLRLVGQEDPRPAGRLS